MKKFLTWIAALTLMLTSAAFAENVPTPHFGTQTENKQTEPGIAEVTAEEVTAEEVTAEEETSAGEGDPVVTYTVPEGTLIYQYMFKKFEKDGFIISDWYFTDTAQAVDAAEKSVKIHATKGNMMLDVKYILYFSQKGVGMSFEEPACTIVDGNGKVYPCSMWVEGERNNLNFLNLSHEGAEVSDHKNAYLIPVDGLSVTKTTTDWRCYVLFDCVAEVPESIVGSDLPLYIIVHQMGETDYYVRIQ